MYSTIRPRSRKPTSAYMRSAIGVDCRLRGAAAAPDRSPGRASRPARCREPCRRPSVRASRRCRCRSHKSWSNAKAGCDVLTVASGNEEVQRGPGRNRGGERTRRRSGADAHASRVLLQLDVGPRQRDAVERHSPLRGSLCRPCSRAGVSSSRIPRSVSWTQAAKELMSAAAYRASVASYAAERSAGASPCPRIALL